MDRREFFFKQKVQATELNDTFDAVERADHNVMVDCGFFGVLYGAAVSEHGGLANLTVDLSNPGCAYDQTGERTFFSALQNVDCSVDFNSVSTAVVGVGNEKWVSVFLFFKRILSDPRVDGNSNTVQFQANESFGTYVTQGAEAPIGTAVRPGLESNKVLLADVNLVHGTTQILNAAISTTRRQDGVVVTGTPRSVRRGRVADAIADVLGFYNAHVTGAADKHAGTDLTYGGGGNWADGTTNPATTVSAELTKIVNDLATGTGTAKVHGSIVAGTRFALTAQRLDQQLSAITAAIDGIKTNGADTILQVADITALKAIDAANRPTHCVAIVGHTALFIFDAADTTTPDDIDVVQPTDVAGSNPGRWFAPVDKGAVRLVDSILIGSAGGTLTGIGTGWATQSINSGVYTKITGTEFVYPNKIGINDFLEIEIEFVDGSILASGIKYAVGLSVNGGAYAVGGAFEGTSMPFTLVGNVTLTTVVARYKGSVKASALPIAAGQLSIAVMATQNSGGAGSVVLQQPYWVRVRHLRANAPHPDS